MPRWLVNLMLVLFIIGVPPFLVLSNISIFLTPQYLQYEYGKPDFPKADLFNDKDRTYLASETILYERGDRNFEQFKGLGVYNDRELNHMVDVRVLIAEVSVFQFMDGVLLSVLLLSLVSMPATRAFAARGLLGGALFTVGLFGFIGIAAGTTFDTFFIAFHRVFFQGDTWLFYTTDSLIQFYPVKFWYDTAIALVSLTVVEALIIGTFGWWWVRKLARAEGQPAASQSTLANPQ